MCNFYRSQREGLVGYVLKSVSVLHARNTLIIEKLLPDIFVFGYYLYVIVLYPLWVPRAGFIIDCGFLYHTTSRTYDAWDTSWFRLWFLYQYPIAREAHLVCVVFVSVLVCVGEAHRGCGVVSVPVREILVTVLCVPAPEQHCLSIYRCQYSRNSRNIGHGGVCVGDICRYSKYLLGLG